jgi:sec-independent protein translocase protein TatA
MGWFGPTELLIILLIILLVFGPSKLGDVGGALGKAIRDFKRAVSEPENPPSASAKPDETKPGESKPGPTA